MNLNKCQFIGRIGKEPEIKEISADFKVANFSIAISEKWTDKTTGEKKELTEWVNCQAANKQAELVEKWVKKGDEIYIEGKFRTRSWENNGPKHYASYIQVDAIQLGAKPKQEEQRQSNPSGLPPSEMAHSDNQPQPEEDDLPF